VKDVLNLPFMYSFDHTFSIVLSFTYEIHYLDVDNQQYHVHSNAAI